MSFVVTKLLLWQTYFCGDKHLSWPTQVCCDKTQKYFVTTNIILLRQKFCHGKHTFFATKIILVPVPTNGSHGVGWVQSVCLRRGRGGQWLTELGLLPSVSMKSSTRLTADIGNISRCLKVFCGALCGVRLFAVARPFVRRLQIWWQALLQESNSYRTKTTAHQTLFLKHKNGTTLQRTGIVLHRIGIALHRTDTVLYKTGIVLHRTGHLVHQTGNALQRTGTALHTLGTNLH